MNKSKKIEPETIVCSECGSADVETKAWVDVNTDEVMDYCSDEDIEDNWCRNCEEHVLLTTYKEYTMKKIFDTEGDLTVRFAKDDTEGINKWLAESGIELYPERVYKFAKEVNCPIFGLALEFPCSVIEN